MTGRERPGRALREALAAGPGPCGPLADEDLRHLQRRASPGCVAAAKSFYCDRVDRARAVVGRTPTAAPVEELCGARAVTNVQTELRSFKEAALAYLILAHDKFVQVRRLVARLLPPSDGLALVHLDQKVATESQLEDFRRWAARSFDNGRERVRIFSEFSVHRGGRSMLDVQLRAIALLLASPVAWEYYINLSDTHYPADAASWFASYLWLHRGTNYARITSTKYYDPTLQGGRHASYSGPRAEDVYIACDRSLAFECEGQLFSLTPGSAGGAQTKTNHLCQLPTTATLLPVEQRPP